FPGGVRLAADRSPRVRRRGGRRAGAEPAGLGGVALVRLRSLGVLGGDVDLRRLAQALLEGLDPLADAAHHLGQPAGPEHYEDDHEHDQQLADPHPEHARIIGEAARAGKLLQLRCPGVLPILRRLACRRPSARRTSGSSRWWRSPAATSATSGARSARTRAPSGCASPSASRRSTRSRSPTWGSRSSTTYSTAAPRWRPRAPTPPRPPCGPSRARAASHRARSAPPSPPPAPTRP